MQAQPSASGLCPLWSWQRRLPTRRGLRRFRASLEAAIHDALAMVAEAAPATAVEDIPHSGNMAVLGAACAVCEGRCCKAGDTHAFLTARELASQLARGPPVSAEELLDAYMALLPDRSYEGSCVYHTERGCALPRPMRSDVCNQYRCPELADLAYRLQTAPAPRILIAAVKDGEVRRAVIVEEDRVIARHPAPDERSIVAVSETR
jgi:hypothetical protein